MTSLVTGVALLNTAMAGASAVATLHVAESAGDAWGGVPNAAAVLGTALGSAGLAAQMARRGRRRGLLTGYGCAAVGAALAVAAVRGGQPVLLVAAMAVLGLGQAAAGLSRYAAAEWYPAARRSTALGVVVWGGAAGGFAGPVLLPVTADAAPAVGLPADAGPYLLAVVAASCAVAVAWRLPARTPAHGPEKVRAGSPSVRNTPRPPESAPPESAPRASGAPTRSSAAVPLTAMATGQVIMVAVMTMAPLHLHAHGHGLGVLGVALAAHTAGMFALAPLSGRLADLRGGVATILAGLAVLVTSGLCAVLAPPGANPLFLAAVFLLGYGWNLTFVGGSSLLSGAGVRLQGTVDALVWGASAVASLAAGPLLAAVGFAGLVAAVTVAVAAPAGLILVRRRVAPERRDHPAATGVPH